MSTSWHATRTYAPHDATVLAIRMTPTTADNGAAAITSHRPPVCGARCANEHALLNLRVVLLQAMPRRAAPGWRTGALQPSLQPPLPWCSGACARACSWMVPGSVRCRSKGRLAQRKLRPSRRRQTSRLPPACCCALAARQAQLAPPGGGAASAGPLLAAERAPARPLRRACARTPRTMPRRMPAARRPLPGRPGARRAPGRRSLDVGRPLARADVLQEHLDEEGGLLGVGHPQDGAHLARGAVVARLREAVAHVQHLRGGGGGG